MTPRMKLGDLRPADVLLSRGEGILSDVIVYADGGKYSHSALWSGHGIIQATSHGITHTEASGEHDVYRHRRLDDAGAAEVVAFAKTQLDGHYAYSELVLLGLLFVSRLRTRGALLSRMLDAIGGANAAELKAWLDDAAQNGKTCVCSELVATSFYHTKDQRFAIRVLPFSARPDDAFGKEELPSLSSGDSSTRHAEPEPSPDAVAQAGASCFDLLLQSGWSQNDGSRGAALVELQPLGAQAARSTRNVLTQAIAVDAVTGAQVGVVTPADLQFSPSLEFIGQFRA